MSEDFITVPPQSFNDLGLAEPIICALDKAGYQEPTPIQAAIIPHVMNGRDVVGQAQTGTGKTAAFALPLLNTLRPTKKARPQVLVLTPTRELAIQVSESFSLYGQNLNHLKVLPLYGGQEYAGQLQQLSKGVQVIVGTPGRVMDHIRRGSLKLDSIQSLVLDEADEMLKMGFLEDVEWVLEQMPEGHQTALFSATMPPSIRRIAATYLSEPAEVTIKTKTVTASTIDQNYLITRGFAHKKEALAKILEAEDFESMLIFVRTKLQTVELAEHITSLGYSCAPLNGDIAQSQRLRTVEQLKGSKIDILVATDVAARGLDVERISHVLNFDVPFDTEAYIHRIGRTGRAGRTGKAILFLTPRERSMLKSIERATKQKIDVMQLPTVKEINAKRINQYKSKITDALATDCSFFAKLIDEYCSENEQDPQTVAAALAKMAQGPSPLLLPKESKPSQKPARFEREGKPERNGNKKNRRNRSDSSRIERGMERYRLDVGNSHGVRPANIVGAIANEADIDSEFIGRISIYDDFSTVDLPNGMPRGILKTLNSARINGRAMRIRKDESTDGVTGNGKEQNRQGRPPRRGKNGSSRNRKPQGQRAARQQA